jgi:hypothetical protein
MQLVGEIDAGLVERIQNRPSSAGELGKRLVDQTRGTLRPRVEKRPG